MQISFLKNLVYPILLKLYFTTQNPHLTRGIFKTKINTSSSNLGIFHFLNPFFSPKKTFLYSSKLNVFSANQEYINKKRFNASVANGFSLIELLVVFSIIGITIGVGAFRWQHFQQQHELTSSMQKMLIFLSNIQTQANWDNQTYLINLDKSAEQSCLIITRKSDTYLNNCQPSENPQEQIVFRLPAKSVNFKSISPSELAFYGTRNSAKAGNIVIENSLGSLRLVLSVRGRLRVCSETAAIKVFPTC